MNCSRLIIKKIASALAIAIMAFAPAATAFAASLSLSSRSTTVTAGDIVTVRIAVSSADQAINTAEGALQFPSDILQAVSVDKSSSIFTIWVEEPHFSNSTGEVDFSGGLPSPGFQGSGGTVLTATFTATHSGTATLSLANASVRANDGMGTDVLQSSGTLQLTVSNPQAAPAPVIAQPVAPATPAPKPTPVPGAAGSDTSPPVISASKFSYDPATGMLNVTAKAKDAGSGIANYSVTIDSASTTNIVPAAFGPEPYQIPVHTAGSHTVVLAVTDVAGNTASVPGTFQVPVIPPPTLSPLPETLNSGTQLSIQGTAPKEDASVIVYLAKDGATPTRFAETPDTTGSFIALGPSLQKGTYEAWAVGVSAGGIESAPTEKTRVIVSDVAVLNLGSITLTLADILTVFLGLTLLSLLIAGIGWYKVYTYHRGRKRAVAKIQKDVHRALGVFKDDVEEHLDAIENAGSARQLSTEEGKLRTDLKSNLADLEKFIDGEVT